MFLGVARVEDRVIIASMSYGAEVKLDGVIKVGVAARARRAGAWIPC